MAADLRGQTLGQYQITEIIGSGGMATVYRAHQASVERDVAIKVMSGQLIENEEFVKRFKREAHLVASFSHPHILKIFDFGQHGDLLFLVMDLIHGGSLAQLIRRNPQPVDQVIRFLDQISEALDHAHARGVIHRDLKPQNILLDEARNVYLADFGIARLTKQQTSMLTQANAVMGTPLYMAPEQWISGSAVDARADIYALSIILYEMLSGDVPFRADTNFAVMHKHLNEPPPKVTSIRPDIPPEVDDVIARGLAKRPDERYQSAGELAQAFKQALTPVNPPMKEYTSRRFPVALALLAAGVLLVVLQAVVWLASNGGAANSPTPPPTLAARQPAALTLTAVPVAVVAATSPATASPVPSVTAETQFTSAAIVPTLTVTLSDTATLTNTPAPTATSTVTATALPTNTATAPPTSTETPTSAATDTLTATLTASITLTRTNTLTFTTRVETLIAGTLTRSAALTATVEAAATATPTVDSIATLVAAAFMTDTARAPTPTSTFTDLPPATLTPIPPTSAPPTAVAMVAGSHRVDAVNVAQVLAPAGCFMMGSDASDTEAKTDESPAHQVCLTRDYWIDAEEVSNQAFQAFVDAGGYKDRQYWSDDGWSWVQKNNASGPLKTTFSDPSLPRVEITWYEADAYARWRGGRLPTEAEWEFAARGPNSFRYPWGNTFDASRAQFSKAEPLPVGSLRNGASWVGARNMAGNVWEWTADWYASDYYSSSPATDPGGPDGPGEVRAKTIRGGGWNTDASFLRSAVRGKSSRSNSSRAIGFRVVSAASGSPVSPISRAALPTPTTAAMATNCPAPDARFVSIWTRNNDELGCPIGPLLTMTGTSQPFRGGVMIWRSDNRTVYVVRLNGEWAAYQENWKEGEALRCSGPNIDRGFGKVYCDNPEVQRVLGAATGGERPGSTLFMQACERGLLLDIASVGKRMLSQARAARW